MEQNKKDSKKESAIDRLRESQEKLDQLDVPDFTTKSISFDQGDQSLKNIQKVINENKEKEATVPVESTRVIKKIKSIINYARGKHIKQNSPHFFLGHSRESIHNGGSVCNYNDTYIL